MKVFISWSGELSKSVAELLKDWLPNVLQNVETWLSSEDIEKGETWFGALSAQLSEISVGVICLTGENLKSPWILFEAGALSKGLTKARVCTLLIDLEPQNLTAPLSAFNATKPTKEDMLKLVKSINSTIPEEELPEKRLNDAFDRWWARFSKEYKKILAGSPKSASRKRETQDMTVEILQLTRQVHSFLQEERRGSAQPFYNAIYGTGLPPSGYGTGLPPSGPPAYIYDGSTGPANGPAGPRYQPLPTYYKTPPKIGVSLSAGNTGDAASKDHPSFPPDPED